MTEIKKRCGNCNKLFGPRKMQNGKTEEPSRFRKKQFCSGTCAAIDNRVRIRIAAAEVKATV